MNSHRVALAVGVAAGFGLAWMLKATNNKVEATNNKVGQVDKDLIGLRDELRDEFKDLDESLETLNASKKQVQELVKQVNELKQELREEFSDMDDAHKEVQNIVQQVVELKAELREEFTDIDEALQQRQVATQEEQAATKDYTPDGPVARSIAAVTPYYPFKGIERFYDIGGFLSRPEVFQTVIDVFVDRYREQKIDAIFGFDARGFVLGPPIALALKIPFYMLRKKGKMPNTVSGSEYTKEYTEAKADVLTIQRGACKAGDRVLLIDDLVATGGTLLAGIELIHRLQGVVVECACVVEIKFLNARAKFEEKGFSNIPIWALCSEDILTVAGELPEGYEDDGEAH